MAPTASQQRKGPGGEQRATKEEKVNTPISGDALQANLRVLNYCKTFLAIVAGIVAGILGLTNLSGLLCYLAVMVLSAIGLLFKAGFSIESYFDSWTTIALHGSSGGLMSFVLFWTLAYNIVHIF